MTIQLVLVSAHCSLVLLIRYNVFCAYNLHCYNFAVKEILKLCSEKLFVTLYKVPSFDSVDDFLQKVATVRGKLKKGGIVDVDAAARIVLHDWNEGIISLLSHLLNEHIKTCNF